MLMKSLLVVFVMASATGTASASGCDLDINRSTASKQVIEQARQCLRRQHDRSLTRGDEKWHQLHLNALNMLAQMEFAYQTAMDMPVFRQGAAERRLYSELAALLSDLSQGIAAGDYQARITAIGSTLPLRTSDPAVTSYQLLDDPASADRLLLEIRGASLPTSDVSLFNPETGDTYLPVDALSAEGTLSADNADQSSTGRLTNRLRFSIPASRHVHQQPRARISELILDLPARRARYAYPLLISTPPPALGQYQLTLSLLERQTRTSEHAVDLGRFESTLTQVREESREVCAPPGWIIPADAHHRIEIHDSRHGRITGSIRSSDRCFRVDLFASPWGRGFGNERAKQGFVEATLRFPVRREIVAPGTPVVLKGDLQWGMSKTIPLDGEIASLDLAARYFDGSEGHIRFPGEDSDQRYTRIELTASGQAIRLLTDLPEEPSLSSL